LPPESVALTPVYSRGSLYALPKACSIYKRFTKLITYNKCTFKNVGVNFSINVH